MQNLILEEYKLNAPKDWDLELSSLPSLAQVEQSSKWAEIVLALGNAKPIYLKILKGKKLQASLLCFDEQDWDYLRNQKSRKPKSYIRGRHLGSLSWHWGPNYFTTESFEQIEATKKIVEWVEDFSQRNRRHAIRGYISDQMDENSKEVISEVFIKNGYEKKLWANFLVDLSVDEIKIWQNLKSSGRKAVKKARKAGLIVSEITTNHEFESLWMPSYRLFEKMASREPAAVEVFRLFWRIGNGSTHRYFVAQTENNEVMAVLGMMVFNGTAREFSSSINPIAYSRKLPAQDLLHWEMMMAAKRAGCEIFNLSGVDPSPNSNKAKGIKQFKAKWGGKYVETPRFFKQLSGPFGLPLPRLIGFKSL
jgi:hypothetical protein